MIEIVDETLETFIASRINELDVAESLLRSQLDEIMHERRKLIAETNLSPQLSKLKEDGVVCLERGRWRLTEKEHKNGI